MSSPATPKAAAAPVGRSNATPAGEAASKKAVVPMISMLVGVIVIVGALGFVLVEREPEIEILDIATAFACPPGVESRSGRMRVTANTLNVRAGPSTRADRMPDRTLRKHTSVTEECRSGGWSRVRLVDGRWGWVANQYLAAVSIKN